ncbi:hypothetical protein DET48_12210 [Vibrio diazotrophicus]|uniref:Uncharacterized protein n=1 Tax=Vibrio diazotrophicus TaxID=685 RepID=A0A329ECV2_VIBDI|nr:hypothetical protein DET48_12210 [Vibrio diazotrophicus]
MKVRSIHTVANNKNKAKQLPTTSNEPHLTPSDTSSNDAIAPIRQKPPKKTIRELFSQTRDCSIVFDRKAEPIRFNCC